MMKPAILAAVCALPLSACATTSFAPPGVKVNYADGSGSTMTCAQQSGRVSDRTVTVARDVAGALTVVEAYIDAYDCSARAAADGRQLFEVPGVLTATGAAVAAALGAGTDVAILATGAGSLFNAGKAYYDPKDKALIYTHALDALRCVRSEAMGIDNFAMFRDESEEDTDALASLTESNDPKVKVSVYEQYFVMVTNAAGSISGILADRLSDVGSKFDPAGTQAELEKLLAQIEEQKNKKKDKTGDAPPPPSGSEDNNQMAAMMDARERYEEEMVDLDLKLLQPKLQTCVWRAKV